ncbi:MAG TPA: flagellar basal body-associated FliL family protein [Spirochaetales bacterium]|nr:flagellar basal body-associated FliL family protein [Spirochaetales bacterium]
MSRLERVLAVVLAAVVVAIATGSAYAAMTGSRARKLAREAVPAAAAGSGVYDGLGRLRARTADDDPAVVVVDMAFPYDASDRQFGEELSRRRGDLRDAVVAYLGSKRADELGADNEAAVKAALRDTLNAILSLGSVEELYFAEFSVIR